MMPEGPLGFPRLTSLFPFVSEDLEQELKIETHPFTSAPNNSIIPILKESGIITRDVGKTTIMKLSIREPLPKREDGIINTFKESIDEIKRSKQVSHGIYSHFIEDNVGTIDFIGTSNKFQNEGIGTRMMENLLQHASENGVDSVYAYPISGGGGVILQRTGFEESDKASTDDRTIYVRRF